MDKTTVGLLGVAAGMAAMGSAQAASSPGPNVSEAMQASSYADLLSPVQDAVAVMQADDAARASQVELPSGVQLAEGYYYNYGPAPAYHDHHHHHHHHHQQAYNRHHHHHHHHQQGTYVGVPGVGGVVVGGR